jgi:hypothetical protein
MKGWTAIVFSIIWGILIMLIGFVVTAQLVSNATANASGALTGTAATNWTTFVNIVWAAFSILAITPIVMVALMFGGLFGGSGGRGQT